MAKNKPASANVSNREPSTCPHCKSLDIIKHKCFGLGERGYGTYRYRCNQCGFLFKKSS